MRKHLKAISRLLFIVLVFAALTGCNRQNVPTNLDMEEVYQAILDAQGDNKGRLILFPEPEDSAYVAELYPGLSDISLKQQAVYIAPVTGFATEIILVEVENSKDTDTVKDIFQSRIDAAVADTTYPETAAQWKKNAQVQAAGNYVCMIVLSDEYVIPEDVFNLISE